MTDLAIDDLLTAATPAEVLAELYTLLEDLDLPTTTWEPGDPLRTVLAVLAQVLGGYSTLQVVMVKSGFLDEAEQGWLTLIAREVYGVERIEATAASTDVTLVNSGGGVYSFDPGELVVKNGTTDATYTNTAIVSLGASTTLTGVNVQAQDVGTAGNAAIGQINTLVTVLTDVTVTNPTAAAGTDEETDAALRARCRLKLGALSPNGPARAYEYVALTPELNGGVAVTRVRVLPPPGDGTLTVVIASAAGVLVGGDVALVQAGIDEWATPSSVDATVVSATGIALSPTIDLFVSTAAGMSDLEWEAAAKIALVDWVPTLPIGGVDLGAGGIVSYRAMIGVLEGINGYVLEARVTPASDTPLTSTQVATLDEGDVTVNVTQVTV